MASDRERLLDQDHRVEQHADRDEEQHRKSILQRQRIGSGPMAEVGFAHDDAGKERAEREGYAENRRRAEGDAERDGKNGEREQLTRAGAGDQRQQPGNEPSGRA